MVHSVASDLVLHCLSMSHKMDARLIWWVNTVFYIFFCHTTIVSFIVL